MPSRSRHHLDDQAETVLFNLLRGAGLDGASGMPARGRLGRKTLLRPLLGVPRSAIRAYAAEHRLGWIEDESNADEALTRNFIRRRVGPLLESRFPRWRENLARAARHFAGAELDAQRLLRAYLKGKGLRAPSEAKLVEMLKQLGSRQRRDRARRRGFAPLPGKGLSSKSKEPRSPFKPQTWNGEARLRTARARRRAAFQARARAGHRQRSAARKTLSRCGCAPAASACSPTRAGRAAR